MDLSNPPGDRDRMDSCDYRVSCDIRVESCDYRLSCDIRVESGDNRVESGEIRAVM